MTRDGLKILRDRGVADDVREARPYRRYDAGAGPAEIPELARHPVYLKSFAGPSDGWLMVKHPVLDHLPPIRPQLRPDKHPTTKYVLAPKREGELDDSKRLDRHPSTDFTRPGPVFFVIEGTPKNDALVSCGAKTFNVPSVAQWPAPELREFARLHLMREPVFVVPDSDWNENPEVIFHAVCCREYLRRIGVNAHIAAPPPRARPDASGSLKQGVDDFLGPKGSPARRHSPGGLLVLEREVDESAFAAFWQRYVAEVKAEAESRGGRGPYEKTLKLDEDVARMVVLTSHNRRSLRGVDSLTRAVLGEPTERRHSTRAERRARVAELAAMDEDELFEAEWTPEHYQVYRALGRLHKAEAFRATGGFPRWMHASWKRVGTKGDGSPKWVRKGPGMRKPIPEIELHPDLRLIEREPVRLDRFLKTKMQAEEDG